MRFSLRNKLVLIIMITAVFATLSIGLVAYSIEKKLINEQVDKEMTSLSEAVINEIVSINNQEMTILRALSLMPVFKDPETTSAQKNKSLNAFIKQSSGKYDIFSFFDLL